MDYFSSSVMDIQGRVEDEVDGEIIKGAIDYILLPLLILGVSGPIFVVMYIVMAYVEFRLPPSQQAGRGLENTIETAFLTARDAIYHLFQ